MTAEITSRHVSCGILTNYETFSLFHHPEDRCDEIFVHAFTTSDGRSQPDAVIGSPLGFMLAVTLLVVRDRGLEWDLGLVEEEEEVERGDDRPGVGRGQGPGDVMDRHGAEVRDLRELRYWDRGWIAMGGHSIPGQVIQGQKGLWAG
jgi:hypothetical protein